MKQESLLRIRRLFAAGLCTVCLTAANGVCADTEYRELKLGTEHNDVADLQERLTELGYYNGRISGHYGELTRDAVLEFQEDNGLEADGIAGAVTQELLFEGTLSGADAFTGTFNRVLKEGSKGADVLALQQRLRAMGYYGGSITGNFGSITAQAVMDFQDDNGLSSDGVVGDRTLALLNSTSSSGS